MTHITLPLLSSRPMTTLGWQPIRCHNRRTDDQPPPPNAHRLCFATLGLPQITLVRQEQVPALEDDCGRIAMRADDCYQMQTKPHGHGDVHSLLHSSGVAKRWSDEKRRYVIFFQVSGSCSLCLTPCSLAARLPHCDTHVAHTGHQWLVLHDHTCSHWGKHSTQAGGECDPQPAIGHLHRPYTCLHPGSVQHNLYRAQGWRPNRLHSSPCQ